METNTKSLVLIKYSQHVIKNQKNGPQVLLYLFLSNGNKCFWNLRQQQQHKMKQMLDFHGKQIFKEQYSSQKSQSSPTQRKKNGYAPKKEKVYRKWTLAENKEYAKTLKNLEDDFRTENKRRINQVFKTMSAILVTKTACQCRSHHQKMMIAYGSVQGIISYFLLGIKPVKKLKPLQERRCQKKQSFEVSKLLKETQLQNIQMSEIREDQYVKNSAQIINIESDFLQNWDIFDF